MIKRSVFFIFILFFLIKTCHAYNCPSQLEGDCILNEGKYQENNYKIIYTGVWIDYNYNSLEAVKASRNVNSWLEFWINGTSLRINYIDGHRNFPEIGIVEMKYMAVCIDDSCNTIAGTDIPFTLKSKTYDFQEGIHYVRIKWPEDYAIVESIRTKEINLASIEIFNGVISNFPEHYCGDGIIDNGEICDDGEDNGLYGYCKTDCSGLGEHCGDGIKNGVEDCDDSNNPCCKNDCRYNSITESCGEGVCKVTKEVCINGVKLGCIIDESQKTEEICWDNLDNDCDGTMEEDCECIQDKICGSDIGECRQGIQRCVNGKLNSVCESTIGPSEEICDNRDNDCDGFTDENAEGKILKQTCYSGKEGTENKGLCKTGEMSCIGGNYTECIGEIIPRIEVCDGFDNDCNGYTDDLFEGNLPFCYELPGFSFEPIGVCSELKSSCVSGKFICNYENAKIETPKENSCDNLDNDCNGDIDENCPCKNGEEKPCGKEKGECKLGIQKCVDEKWGECNAVQPSEEICDNKDNNCNGKTDELLVKVCNDDCGGEQICQNGEWTPCKCINGAEIEIKITSNDIGMFVINADLDNEDVKDILSSLKEVNQSISSDYKNGKTEITTSFSSDKQLKDVDYALYIPKCLSPYLDDLDFEDKNYRIIQEDPLIAWHFSEVKDRIDLSYSIKGKISEECLQQIKALPIAKIIGPRLEEKQQFDFKKIILPIMLIALIGTIVIFIQRPKNETKTGNEEEDLEKNAVEKQRQSLLKQIKGMKFKTKDQGEAYMRSLGMSEETIQWVMKRI